MKKRKRSQVGQRISPWPVASSGLKVNVGCPLCYRASWLERIFEVTVDGHGNFMARGEDRWYPMDVDIRPMRRWPRKPSGGRGFYWERIPRPEFDEQFPRTVHLVRYFFAKRAIEWLELLGIDVSSARNCPVFERIRPREPS